MTAAAEPPRIVVMGPSGAGKSVVGVALAERLSERFVGLDFVDADDLHPPSNVAKMRAGVALDDADRMPWLDAVGRTLATGTRGRVVACSALRRSYRDVIRGACPDARFVELIVPPDQLGARVGGRPGHFMPSSLVASQLQTLEALDDDERGARIENAGTVEHVVSRVIAVLETDW
ncbi:gluconokinase [Agromyces sp. H66]|uniref:gluconokinase n=1 Tax=Agromyces sp. H66 TaxID=2529859 RepID=UPI0020BFEA28|nr:gluconokinase [Agromyces sp. H66]